MICPNCAKSIVDVAKFCSFCGAQQPIKQSSQPASANTSFDSAMRGTSLEASDVTVILPRRRVDALVASAGPAPSEKGVGASTASKGVFDNVVTSRPHVPAMKVGAAAAAIAIIAVFVVVFHANRPATTTQEPKVPGKAADTPATALERISMPPLSPIQGADSVGPPTNAASTNAAMPNVPAMDATTSVKDTSTTDAPGTGETKLQVPPQRSVAAPKDDVQRKKGRTPAPAPEPAPIQSLAPEPIASEPPAATPSNDAPLVQPAKVERVVCEDSPNFFSRERCLWQECAKPENRSLGECARFTGPSGQR